MKANENNGMRAKLAEKLALQKLQTEAELTYGRFSSSDMDVHKHIKERTGAVTDGKYYTKVV